MADEPAPRDERITTATLELLRAKGPRAVTIEAVAALSGVAKTTIYRRYNNRGEMLTASLSSVAEPESPADTATPSKIVQWVVEQSLRVVETSIGAGGVAALLTDDDPEFVTLIRSLLVQHRRHLSTALRQALHAEGPRPDLDVETLLDMIVGAYLAEIARSGSVRPEWSKRVLSILAPMIAAGDPSR